LRRLAAATVGADRYVGGTDCLLEHLVAVEAAHTDEVLAGVPLEQTVDSGPAGPPDFNVRWVMLHLIEETARHAGHADLMREAIDGVQADRARERWAADQ
jgi:hypothetical protein